jgi:hypothetical protein
VVTGVRRKGGIWHQGKSGNCYYKETKGNVVATARKLAVANVRVSLQPFFIFEVWKANGDEVSQSVRSVSQAGNSIRQATQSIRRLTQSGHSVSQVTQ